MPIVVKDYIWKQTTDYVTVQIPIKGVHQSNVDIFTSPKYIKAKFGQNFFEIILLHSIDVSKSKCTITQTHIVFELRKNDGNIWESLEPNIPKTEKLALKKELLDKEYLRIQKERQEQVNKTAELKRVAVREQIEIDTKNRQHIEDIKKQEETNALGDINQWTATLSPKCAVVDEAKQCKSKIKNTENKASIKLTKKILPPPAPLPIRSSKTLQIDFTPREFPTPSRESKLDEENEWLRKQAEARRSSGFITEDIRPEEKNPQFLKAKGDEFFKNKNNLGAISAYSFGIKLSEKFVDLYIARSEVHLQLGNYNKVIQDCSTALDLLKPEVPINLKERALCIGRRGVALVKFGFVRQGIEELRISLKLLPNDYFRNALEEAQKDYEKQH